MSDVDYTSKIRKFQHLTDNYNEDEALNYLMEANWDENLASKNYLKSKSNKYDNKINNEYKDRLLDNNYVNSTNNISNTQNNQLRANITNNNQNTNNNNNNENNTGFISYYIKRPLSYIASMFCSKCFNIKQSRGNSSDDYSELKLKDICMYEFPNKLESLKEFNDQQDNSLGLFIFYNTSEISKIENIAKELNNDKYSYIKDIIKVNYKIVLFNVDSVDAKDTLTMLNNNYSVNNLVVFFVKKSLNLNNKLKVIDKIESNEYSIEILKDKIINNIEATPNTNKNEFTNNNTADLEDEKDVNTLTGAQLIEHQKKELEKLEEEELNKQRLIQEEKIKEENILKEKAINEEKRKILQKEKHNSLPSEPSHDDKNATSIVFRYPNDDTRKERRFLKTDKISILYDFVASLGTDMFEESNEFDLITPFPVKIFSDMEKTLEEEKLFPNAVIQIREI